MAKKDWTKYITDVMQNGIAHFRTKNEVWQISAAKYFFARWIVFHPNVYPWTNEVYKVVAGNVNALAPQAPQLQPNVVGHAVRQESYAYIQPPLPEGYYLAIIRQAMGIGEVFITPDFWVSELASRELEDAFREQDDEDNE